MRGVLFFFFVVLVLLLPSLSTDVINTLSPVESLTISSNRTIVSRGDVFELGFFKTTASSRDGDRWYLGIWYKKISERVYIWVANRDNPLSNSIGTLKISNGNLVLLDHSNISIWSTNLTEPVRSPVMAELLANGNFVLRDFKTNDPDGFLWQSFDFPTDTLLPEMKMGWDLKTGHNKFLRSWKSPYDPSSGDLWYKLEPRGLSEFFLWKRDVRVHRSGPWDGTRFSGIPEMQQWNNVDIVYNFTDSREEVAYTFRVTDHNIYSRLTMSSSGRLEYSTLIPTDEGWNIFWVSSTDQCDMYEYCGPYSYCDMNTSPMCKCIKGFEPRDSKEWDLGDETSGCVRKTQLNCKGEDFVRLSKMKLPDTTTAIVDRRIGLKECQEKCLQNCNCTAFANTDIRNGGTGCVIWVGKLVDIRNYADGGQDLYVKLAASDLGNEKNTRPKIIGWIVGVIAVLFLSFIIFYCWKRKQKLARPITSLFVNQEKNQDLLLNGMVISSGRHLSGEDEAENIELPLMGFEAVAMATDNFSDSNKLGQGGFGTVYKGRLFNGQEIAVKRLSEMSHQGTHEFKNEVKLISKLQHINLVRILGCCVDAKEKMIIYEYLENSSLDHYLFDKTRSRELNWQRRFNITNGIARGILYLHQDSRCRIVHRDLKASNVLLDKDMIPKISDFGMARIFGRDEEEAVTRRIVGTYGYMSPEYAMEGIFSVKSDVYSFGVLVLEIISGKQNRRYYNSNHDITLVSWAWRNWNEGKGLEIIDPIILDPSSSSVPTFLPQEALRCIQIGLLCVQERVEDRPMMSSVVLMLGSGTEVIPHPKPPGYFVQRSSLETDSPSSKQPDEESCTVNQITLSVIDGR